MPLIACPDCAYSVSSAAPACPRCGRPIATVPAAPDPRAIARGVHGGTRRAAIFDTLAGLAFAASVLLGLLIGAVVGAGAGWIVFALGCVVTLWLKFSA